MDWEKTQHPQPANEITATPPGHRSGFVGIVGRPNVGKSTILNHFLGEKMAITSPSPQTTRQRILGVLTRADAQIAFLDTPGLHQPQHALGRAMLEAAKAVIEEADVLLAVVDGQRGLLEEDHRVFERLRMIARPRLVAINKTDLANKPRLLPIIQACADTGLFTDCIPVSALTGDQMDVLLQRVMAHLPEGPRWYTPDQRTDQTTEQRIRELIREPILVATRQEVPYAVAVLIDQMVDEGEQLVIDASVLVDRPGQKAIVIGRGAQQLKRITQRARRDVARLLKRKIRLTLWVKVREHWRSDPRILRELGYG